VRSHGWYDLPPFSYDPVAGALSAVVGSGDRGAPAELTFRAKGGRLLASGAGLSPAHGVAPDTQRAMQGKNIDMQHHFPKGLQHLSRSRFDLVVNMSGFDLPKTLGVPIRKWEVPDPISMDFEQHCEIRDRIETLVMNLILELRRSLKSRIEVL
jgi:protein-tyrosine-phosphatase